MAYKLWTKEEVDVLTEKVNLGLSTKEIQSYLLGKSECSISKKIFRMKLDLYGIQKKLKGLKKTHFCNSCKTEKLVKDFRLKKNGNPTSPCKNCIQVLRTKRYREDHEYRKRIISNVKTSYIKRRDHILDYKSGYREKNRELINERQKEARAENPEYFKKKARESYGRYSEKRAKEKRDARKENPEHHRAINKRAAEKRKADPIRDKKHKEWQKRYYQENKEKILEWERNYRNGSPQRKISVRLRNRINMVLRYKQGIEKKTSTEALLGCSIEKAKEWLEAQFTEDMTWDAFLAGEIHIDHIRPCASFDLTKKSEQLECFNWKNLQPLWAKDNLEKGAKFGSSTHSPETAD